MNLQCICFSGAVEVLDVSMPHQDTQALELVERVARENYNSPKVDAHRWVLTRMDNGKASMAHAKIGWSFTTC